MAPLPSPVSPETLASIVAEQSPGRPDDPWLHLLPGRSMLALTFVLAVTVILSACTVSPVPGPSSAMTAPGGGAASLTISLASRSELGTMAPVLPGLVNIWRTNSRVWPWAMGFFLDYSLIKRPAPKGGNKP